MSEPKTPAQQRRELDDAKVTTMNNVYNVGTGRQTTNEHFLKIVGNDIGSWISMAQGFLREHEVPKTKRGGDNKNIYWKLDDEGEVVRCNKKELLALIEGGSKYDQVLKIHNALYDDNFRKDNRGYIEDFKARFQVNDPLCVGLDACRKFLDAHGDVEKIKASKEQRNAARRKKPQEEQPKELTAEDLLTPTQDAPPAAAAATVTQPKPRNPHDMFDDEALAVGGGRRGDDDDGMDLGGGSDDDDSQVVEKRRAKKPAGLEESDASDDEGEEDEKMPAAVYEENEAGELILKVNAGEGKRIKIEVITAEGEPDVIDLTDLQEQLVEKDKIIADLQRQLEKALAVAEEEDPEAVPAVAEAEAEAEAQPSAEKKKRKRKKKRETAENEASATEETEATEETAEPKRQAEASATEETESAEETAEPKKRPSKRQAGATAEPKRPPKRQAAKSTTKPRVQKVIGWAQGLQK